MHYSASKMRLTLRKVLQALITAVLLSFSTVALLRVAQKGQQWPVHQGQSSAPSAAAAAAAAAPQDVDAAGAALVGLEARAPRSLLVEKGDQEGQENGLGGQQWTDQDGGVSASEFGHHLATGTPKPHTSLDDIFISVKTTKNFHQSRLDVILKTWFTLARDQTWFFTDSDDEEYQEKTHNHLINTGCSSSHNRMALCCKMAVEFDTFLESNKRWFCHFDDDNYVNVPQLVAMLQNFPWQDDWYLGKPSIRAPLEILDREHLPQKISFWFATGGAGFCLSRSLALKMMPLASGGKFISIGEKIRLPDDVTMGYIIENLLQKKLTIIEEFHSHLEPMKFLKKSELAQQISFSYSRYGQEMNVLNLDSFNAQVDPYKFLSLHCLLFPNFSFCPR